MSKSLIRKELIEAGAVTAIATVIYLIIVGAEIYEFRSYQIRSHHNHYSAGVWVSLFTRDLYPLCILVPASFAALLGLVQTVSESIQGTWGYLLHLPPARQRVIRIKLTSGLVAYTLCSGSFLAICVLVALSRQTVIRPLEWWMISPVMQCIVSGVLIYLGAFLTGLRPARWYGSRLLPLVGVSGLWGLLLYVPSWWVFGFPLLLVLCVVLIAMIFHVAEIRDYV